MLPRSPRLLAVGLVFTFSALRLAAQQPVDVIGNLSLSDYTSYIQPQTYNDWGNEPFIAVNPVNPSDMIISSFAYGTPATGDPGASLWYSTNGGASWSIRFPINTDPGAGVGAPFDQTYAYDSNGVLHGVVLGINLSNGNQNIYQGSTSAPGNDGLNGHPASSWQWTAQGAINNQTITSTTADQPWMAISGNNILAGYDNFNSNFTAVEERAVMSTDGGATFTSSNDLAVSRGGQVFSGPVNPGLRLTTDSAGHAYAIYGIPSADLGNSVHTIDYRLNRYTFGSSTWDYTNSTSNPGGLGIDSGNSTQGNTSQNLSFGGKNMLLGNVTSVAATADGSRVYAVYGKQDGTGVDRLYLATFATVAGNLVEQPNSGVNPFSIAGERSALPSVAVAANGTIGVLYQTTPSPNIFEVHLALSLDQGLTFSDQTLLSYNTTNIPLQGGNDRLLGDYEDLTAVGDTFYGTFPGAGDTNSGGINTTGIISPYFFEITAPEIAVPEPPTFILPFIVGAVLAAQRLRVFKRTQN
jgi:hypothetical protein